MENGIKSINNVNSKISEEAAMKNYVRQILATFALFVLMGTMTFADEKGKDVTFFGDITVNGTVVKKGNYKVMYNEQAEEMTIMKGKTVIAKAPARVENRSAKAAETELKVTSKDNNKVLRSITFAGGTQTIILNEGATQAVSPQ
jgi:hypothetical protein